MAELTLDIHLKRLPRDYCDNCRRRRVLYVVQVFGVEGGLILPTWLSSMARCAKCLGIGK